MAEIKVTRIIDYDYDEYDSDMEIETQYEECIIDTDDVLRATPTSRGTYLLFKHGQVSEEITLPFDSYAAIACQGQEHLTTYTQIVGD